MKLAYLSMAACAYCFATKDFSSAGIYFIISLVLESRYKISRLEQVLKESRDGLSMETRQKLRVMERQLANNNSWIGGLK